MSEDGDILMNETGTYQVHKISPDGTSQVIIDNLPGFPDNINRGPKLADGRESFLIAIIAPDGYMYVSSLTAPDLGRMKIE